MKLFGSRNPYTTKTQDKVDFFGVVTFELSFEDIGGMECSNSLIENFSRLVFEAKGTTKKAFTTLEEFFHHYNLPLNSTRHYEPALDVESGRIRVKTVWKTINQIDEAEEQEYPKTPQNAANIRQDLFNLKDESENAS